MTRGGQRVGVAGGREGVPQKVTLLGKGLRGDSYSTARGGGRNRGSFKRARLTHVNSQRLKFTCARVPKPMMLIPPPKVARFPWVLEMIVFPTPLQERHTKGVAG